MPPHPQMQGPDVTDTALRGSAPTTGAVAATREAILRRMRGSDAIFHFVTRLAAISVLVVLGGGIVALVFGAWPAIQAFGFGFLTSHSWNPVTEQFGAIAPIYGTVVTAAIAMLVAVPLGLMIALFLTDLCPMWLRRPIGIAIELLAGIPSIIYGIWGLFVFAPFLQRTVQPALIDLFGNVPILSDLFAGPPYGIGILTAGLILAIMVLPLRHLDLARRVRHRPAGPEGGRPTASAARPGRSSATSSCPTRASGSWAASCWASAAPWARPWRSPS
jgi:phosphate transport system permease protein